MFRPPVILCGGGALRSVRRRIQTAARDKNKSNYTNNGTGGSSRLVAAATSSSPTTARGGGGGGGRKKTETTAKGPLSPCREDSGGTNVISPNGKVPARAGRVAHSAAAAPATVISTASRPGKRSEEEIMQLAHRMQQRDLTGEVPVASFAYEVLKMHPSVRQMGLRERMAFLCDRWERLSAKQRQSYLDNPLKGLL